MSERSRDELEQARAKWWVTVSTGDLDGYLALFAEDAVWVTPELDEITGRAAIRDWLEPVFAQFDYELTITVADVRIAGDLGIERARFLSRMSPKTPPFRPHLVADPVGSASVTPLAGASTADDGAWGAADGHPAAQVHAVDPVAVTAPEDEDPDPDLDDAGENDEADSEADDAGAVEPALRAVDDRDEDDDDPGVVSELDDEPHEGRYLMYWRWHDDVGWLVQRYADVTGVG